MHENIEAHALVGRNVKYLIIFDSKFWWAMDPTSYILIWKEKVAKLNEGNMVLIYIRLEHYGYGYVIFLYLPLDQINASIVSIFYPMTHIHVRPYNLPSAFSPTYTFEREKLKVRNSIFDNWVVSTINMLADE